MATLRFLMLLSLICMCWRRLIVTIKLMWQMWLMRWTITQIHIETLVKYLLDLAGKWFVIVIIFSSLEQEQSCGVEKLAEVNQAELINGKLLAPQEIMCCHDHSPLLKCDTQHDKHWQHPSLGPWVSRPHLPLIRHKHACAMCNEYVVHLVWALDKKWLGSDDEYQDMLQEGETWPTSVNSAVWVKHSGGWVTRTCILLQDVM